MVQSFIPQKLNEPYYLATTLAPRILKLSCDHRQVKQVLTFDGQEARLAVEWRLTFVERHLKEGQWGVRPTADQLAGQVNQGAAFVRQSAGAVGSNKVQIYYKHRSEHFYNITASDFDGFAQNDD